MESEHGFDTAIRSVSRFHKGWLPEKLGELYLDAVDHYGLYYWYEDLLEYEQQLKDSIKDKTKT